MQILLYEVCYAFQFVDTMFREKERKHITCLWHYININLNIFLYLDNIVMPKNTHSEENVLPLHFLETFLYSLHFLACQQVIWCWLLILDLSTSQLNCHLLSYTCHKDAGAWNTSNLCGSVCFEAKCYSFSSVYTHNIA